MPTCSLCGAPCRDDALFCPNCGARFAAPEEIVEPVEQVLEEEVVIIDETAEEPLVDEVIAPVTAEVAMSDDEAVVAEVVEEVEETVEKAKEKAAEVVEDVKEEVAEVCQQCAEDENACPYHELGCRCCGGAAVAVVAHGAGFEVGNGEPHRYNNMYSETGKEQYLNYLDHDVVAHEVAEQGVPQAVVVA